MADLSMPASLGSATQVFNSTAPYSIPGDNFLYAYGSNNNLVHIVVVMQRSSRDTAPPGNATVTHSSGTFPIQTINIPTNNRFKFDAFVFVSPNGAQGTFTVTPTANSVAGGAFFLYAQHARSANPIRTWSTAYSEVSNGTNAGPFATTTPTVPDLGILGLEVTPAAGNRNLVIAATSSTATFTEGEDHTNILQIGNANFRAIAEFSEVQSLIAPSVTLSAPAFSPMVSFEVAGDSSVDISYYEPHPFSAYNANEAVKITDGVISVADSYKIYRDGVLIGESAAPTFTESIPLDPGTYVYTVTSIDSAGNESDPSDSLSVEVRYLSETEDVSLSDGDMSYIIPDFITAAPESPRVNDAITLDTRRWMVRPFEEVSVLDYLVAMIPKTLEYDGPVDIADSDLILTDPSGAYIKNFIDPDVVSVYELFRVGVTITFSPDYVNFSDVMPPPTANLGGAKMSEIPKLMETFRVYDRSRGESTTDEWWSIDNVSLNLPWWNITTLGGSRMGVPAMRGEDIQMSMRPGRIWVPKIPDSRVITLIMWVAAIDPATGQPPPYDQRIQWNDNWNALRRMLYRPKKQMTLTRRWKLNRSSPRIDKASAQVQLGGTMDPTMTGRTRADFSVDLVMADPYFYGTEIPETIPVTMDIVNPKIVRVFNPGDDTSGFSHMSVTLYGPLVNPMLVNKSGANGDLWFKLSTDVVGSIPANESVRFDIEKFKATRSNAENTVVTVHVSHSGATTWFALEPGYNDIVLQADAGSTGGHAVIRYQPAYL